MPRVWDCIIVVLDWLKEFMAGRTIFETWLRFTRSGAPAWTKFTKLEACSGTPIPTPWPPKPAPKPAAPFIDEPPIPFPAPPVPSL